MNEAVIEVIKALAIRPELLTVTVLAVVLALMLRRRTKLSVKARKNGTPIFELVINRLTLVMFLLVGVTIIRELASAIAVFFREVSNV